LCPTLEAQLPGEDVVGERNRENLLQPDSQGRIHNRSYAFDAAVEIPLHQVRGADVVARAALVAAEAEDARVLEVAADDRARPDALRQTGHTRTQAAHGPHDQVDLRSCLGGVVERVDRLRVDQVVDLDDDAAVRLRLLADQLD